MIFQTQDDDMAKKVTLVWVTKEEAEVDEGEQVETQIGVEVRKAQTIHGNTVIVVIQEILPPGVVVVAVEGIKLYRRG